MSLPFSEVLQACFDRTIELPSKFPSFVSTSSSSQTSSSLPFVSRTLRHDVVRGMMGMMRISMLVLPMIRPWITAARAGSSSGTGSMMTVTTVAAETTVRLTLVQPTGRYLVAVACRIVHRLRVLIVVIQTVCGLRVGVRVFATYLRVYGSGVLVL